MVMDLETMQADIQAMIALTKVETHGRTEPWDAQIMMKTAGPIQKMYSLRILLNGLIMMETVMEITGGTNPDACPFDAGNSTQGNRLGCVDTDGDGWDDVIDVLPNTPSQWLDQDGDGYGDNATGIFPDACPRGAGNSTTDRYGCPDADGDGLRMTTMHSLMTQHVLKTLMAMAMMI